MKLNQAKAALEDYLIKELGLDKDNVKSEIEEDTLYVSSLLSTKFFDDNILNAYEFSENGVLIVKFILDKLPMNLSNMKMVNEYNRNVILFKCFVSEDSEDKGYLNFNHVFINIKTADDLIESVKFLLDRFVGEYSLKFLKPLADLTTED
jgi:hypothetical protein